MLKQQMGNLSAEEVSIPILTHPRIPDVLLLPVDGPRYVRNAYPASDQWGSALLSTHLFINCSIQPTAGWVFLETHVEYLDSSFKYSPMDARLLCISSMHSCRSGNAPTVCTAMAWRCPRGQILRCFSSFSLLLSELWCSSAPRWWLALSVAALFWEVLTFSCRGSLPALNVRLKHTFY